MAVPELRKPQNWACALAEEDRDGREVVVGPDPSTGPPRPDRNRPRVRHSGSRSYRRSGFSGLSHFSSRTAFAARTPLGSVDGQGTGSPDPLTLTQPDSSRHQINAQPQAGCQLRAC